MILSLLLFFNWIELFSYADDDEHESCVQL